MHNFREKISLLEFTVSIEQEDPNPLFIDTPNNTDLDMGLQGTGTTPCLCTPRLGSTVQLQGVITSSNRQNIVKAVKKAFVTENHAKGKEF